MDVTSSPTAATGQPQGNQAQVGQNSVASGISSDFETFLRMLTAQLQNQDPQNPMKSADFAVQLATFSGVEQQVRSNELLTALGTQMSLMGMAQMAGWVGMEARVAAPAQFNGSPINISPNPAAQADSAVLVVRDADGTIVQNIDIPVSTDPISWAGVGVDGTPMPNGQYSFEVESYSDGALMVTTPAEIYATITEARGQGGETILVLEGGAEVAAGSITALRAAQS